MSDGCFTEQEVYRLKKILTKLKVVMNSSAENDKAKFSVLQDCCVHTAFIILLNYG